MEKKTPCRSFQVLQDEQEGDDTIFLALTQLDIYNKYIIVNLILSYLRSHNWSVSFTFSFRQLLARDWEEGKKKFTTTTNCQPPTSTNQHFFEPSKGNFFFVRKRSSTSKLSAQPLLPPCPLPRGEQYHHHLQKSIYDQVFTNPLGTLLFHPSPLISSTGTKISFIARDTLQCLLRWRSSNEFLKKAIALTACYQRPHAKKITPTSYFSLPPLV